MKFVHLTPQPEIGPVKRNGIRCGDGRRGRGVYAVPLMMMQRVTCTEDHRIIPSEPRSSTTLWQWLGSERRRHRNLAAVTFETGHDHWPADLYITIGPSIGLEWIDAFSEAELSVTEDDLSFVEQAHKEGYCANLPVSVRDQSAMGTALWHIQQAGFDTFAQYDDSIELVFRKPIKSALIDRIVPLYRTNKQFKHDRERRTEAG